MGNYLQFISFECPHTRVYFSIHLYLSFPIWLTGSLATTTLELSSNILPSHSFSLVLYIRMQHMGKCIHIFLRPRTNSKLHSASTKILFFLLYPHSFIQIFLFFIFRPTTPKLDSENLKLRWKMRSKQKNWACEMNPPHSLAIRSVSFSK